MDWDDAVKTAKSSDNWAAIRATCLAPGFDWTKPDQLSITMALEEIIRPASDGLVTSEQLFSSKRSGAGDAGEESIRSFTTLFQALMRMVRERSNRPEEAFQLADQACVIVRAKVEARVDVLTERNQGREPEQGFDDLALRALEDALEDLARAADALEATLAALARDAAAPTARALESRLARGEVTPPEITANAALFLRPDFDWTVVSEADAELAVVAMVAAMGDPWAPGGVQGSVGPEGYADLRLSVDRLVRHWLDQDPQIAVRLATRANALVAERRRVANPEQAERGGAFYKALAPAAAQIFATYFDAALRAGTLTDDQIRDGFDPFIHAMAWRWLKGPEPPGPAPKGLAVMLDRQPFGGLLPLIETTAQQCPRFRDAILTAAISAMDSQIRRAQSTLGPEHPRLLQLVATATLLELAHPEIEIRITAAIGVQVADPGSRGATGPVSASAMVVRVEPGGPAESVGLASGDIIVSLGEATVVSAAGLGSIISAHHPGDQVGLGWVDASGQHRNATVSLAAVGWAKQAALADNFTYLVDFAFRHPKLSLASYLAAPLFRLAARLGGDPRAQQIPLDHLHSRIERRLRDGAQAGAASRGPRPPLADASQGYLEEVARHVLYLDTCFLQIGPGYRSQPHIVAIAELWPGDGPTLGEIRLIHQAVLQASGLERHEFLPEFGDPQVSWWTVVDALAQATVTVEADGTVRSAPVTPPREIQ